MLDFSIRSTQTELLDRDDTPAADLMLNMQELNTINTLLGGHRITLQGFKSLAAGRRRISVLEIGCGGGDNLRVIEAYCKEQGIEAELSGVDLQQDICSFAKAQNPALHIQCCDYRLSRFDTKPDIIFSSLFCHHFSDDALVTQLQWMRENARIGFFINDLHRHPLAYYSIRFLTALFSNSYLVKNDAPVSVARGFKKAEWQRIFAKAGLVYVVLKWKWAFRHLIVFRHGK